MKPTLVILAAGMGSRYGGLKQMDELGPGGESIIDYSVYDAIRAGFGKVVFIIRGSFEEQFKARFEPRLQGRIQTQYVFQELDKLPAGFSVPEGREKPWGTGHAILMAKDAVKEPFAIINADDYYGQEAFVSMAEFLTSNKTVNQYAMVGYALKNTLSENGTVSRGVCTADAAGNLQNVIERTKIGTEGNQIFYYEEEGKFPLTGNEPVSMNFWGFNPLFYTQLEEGFTSFLKEKGTELKSEYYFNACADALIKSGKVTTKIIETDSKWFGITYKEDKPMVQQSILDLIAEGVYPQKLWA